MPANAEFIIAKTGGSYGGYEIEHGISYYDVGGTKKLSFWRARQGIAFDRTDYTVTLTTGTWYHLAYTYSGTTVTGYLSDSSVATGSSSGAGNNNYNYNGINIGCRSASDGTGAYAFTSGKVDEVGMWTKALSSTEVSDLYNAGSGQTMVGSLTKTFSVDTNHSLTGNMTSYWKQEDATDAFGTNDGTATSVSFGTPVLYPFLFLLVPLD